MARNISPIQTEDLLIRKDLIIGNSLLAYAIKNAKTNQGACEAIVSMYNDNKKLVYGVVGIKNLRIAHKLIINQKLKFHAENVQSEKRQSS